MNVLQALRTLFPLLPAANVFESRPLNVPKDPYFVVSELIDGQSGFETYPDAQRRSVQVRTLTLLVTVYGKEGWTLAQLRDLHTPLRQHLAHLITEHPGLPALRGVSRGPVQPPTPDSDSKRPYGAVRLLLTYLE